MSNKILRNKYLFQLLLDSKTSQCQITALLKTLNDSQITALSEIAHNLIEGSLPLSPKAKKLISSHQKILTKLAAKDLSLDFKARFIQKHLKPIFNCLFISRKLLLNLLE